MSKKSSLITANNYLYISFPCNDVRLRWPTGIKYKANQLKSELKKLNRMQTFVDDYAIKSELSSSQVLKKELQAALDREFKPERAVKQRERDLTADHNKMLDKMKSGELLKRRSNGRYSEATIAQYGRMRERWKACADDPQSGFILSYDMRIEHFRNLVVWLTDKKYSKNSIYDIVNNLKIFMKYSYEEGYHNNEVYKHRDFTAEPEESDAIAPTYEEIFKLYNTIFDNERMERVRDVFVYGCFLALRVRDLRRINEYKLIGDFYELMTMKNQTRVVIPCHWIAREIYTKYNGIIPIFHRSNMAILLPNICKIAGIGGHKLISTTIGGRKIERYYERWELISPHTMRRFYATWMYRELRRQPREIMAITGHKTEESFFKYIKIEKEMNAQEILNDPAFRKPV